MSQFAFEIAQPAALSKHRVNNPRANVDMHEPEKPEVIPCITCGKFAFAQPTVCFWCIARDAEAQCEPAL